jgi:hypothetical protein
MITITKLATVMVGAKSMKPAMSGNTNNTPFKVFTIFKAAYSNITGKGAGTKAPGQLLQRFWS